MRRIIVRHLQVLIVIIVLFLAACSGSQTAPLTDTAPPTAPAEEAQPADATATTSPTETAQTSSNFIDRNIDPPALPQDASDLASASGACAVCHTGLFDGNGEEVSFDTLWRASMMAHAARDPYWLATVSSETEEFPHLEEVIADKCATCHMPLAHFDAQANQQPTLILGDGFYNPANQLHDLAMDGISCNLCHQIEAGNLGQAESFSGGYLIDTITRTWGERLSYGPLPVDQMGITLMQQGSGYQPVQSAHTAEASLCGSCHVLYTPYLDENGEVAGEFPEQTTYLEWENSSFSGGACADCHMPKVANMPLSNVLNKQQAYLRKHSFTGANAFMLTMLADNATEIGITATDEQMQAAIGRVTEQLTTATGTAVRFGDVTLQDGILTAEVTVQNNTGHKLPSGFPSRRAWLHVWVTDGNGDTVFESGGYDQNGQISGNDNDLDAGHYEPHYTLIDSAEQVQIYEPIMHTTQNEVTTTLLLASGYLKDNRLMPAGFALENADEAISPKGLAVEDENFLGGRDTITYSMDVSDSSGPYTINIQMLYQSIGYRWAENLRPYNAELTQDFFGYYDQADNLPIEIGFAQHFQEGE